MAKKKKKTILFCQSPLGHLLPHSSAIFTSVVSLTSLAVAVSVSTLVELSPIGIVPEVPLLQVNLRNEKQKNHRKFTHAIKNVNYISRNFEQL